MFCERQVGAVEQPCFRYSEIEGYAIDKSDGHREFAGQMFGHVCRTDFDACGKLCLRHSHGLHEMAYAFDYLRLVFWIGSHDVFWGPTQSRTTIFTGAAHLSAVIK